MEDVLDICYNTGMALKDDQVFFKENGKIYCFDLEDIPILLKNKRVPWVGENVRISDWNLDNLLRIWKPTITEYIETIGSLNDHKLIVLTVDTYDLEILYRNKYRKLSDLTLKLLPDTDLDLKQLLKNMVNLRYLTILGTGNNNIRGLDVLKNTYVKNLYIDNTNIGIRDLVPLLNINKYFFDHLVLSNNSNLPEEYNQVFIGDDYTLNDEFLIEQLYEMIERDIGRYTKRV